MASSSKTQYYDLNQWQSTDQPKWADHTADNAKIDAALRGLAESIHAPYVGEDGYWYEWDPETAAFVQGSYSVGGDGISSYAWVKWSAVQPTQDSDMKDTPDAYIGLYTGTSATAPTTYTSYRWYQYKGGQGDPGTGNNWYTGTAITDTSDTPTAYATGIENAQVGDLYLNTGALPDTGRSYVCTVGGDASTALWVYNALLRGADGAGTGDMLASVYAESAGVVKDSAKLGGQLPSYYVAAAQKGAASGVAELDESGHVPSAQLPSYVDDVVEVSSYANLPGTGETGKIYITLDTNLSYRWSGSGYAEISPSIALGETSATAYRGDRGKTAYDHSQIATGNPHGMARSDIGAAASGANSDITSLSGLTTPLSIAQGGAGANTAAGARVALGVAAAINLYLYTNIGGSL